MSSIPKVVIPGQYIVPAYKTGDSEQVIERYYPGRGTVLSYIGEGSNKIPVLVATVLGQAIIEEQEQDLGDEINQENEKPAPASENGTFSNTSTASYVVSVLPKNTTYRAQDKPTAKKQVSAINLPQENDIVLVKISKITARQAYCEIVSVEGFGNVLSDSGLGANGELAHGSVAPGGGAQAFASHQSVASSQSTLASATTRDLGETFKGIIRSQDVRSTDRDKVKIIDSFKPGDIVRAVILSLGDGSNYYLSTARNDLGVLFATSQNGSGSQMFPLDWQTMVDAQGIVENRKCAKPFVD